MNDKGYGRQPPEADQTVVGRREEVLTAPSFQAQGAQVAPGHLLNKEKGQKAGDLEG